MRSIILTATLLVACATPIAEIPQEEWLRGAEATIIQYHGEEILRCSQEPDGRLVECCRMPCLSGIVACAADEDGEAHLLAAPDDGESISVLRCAEIRAGCCRTEEAGELPSCGGPR